ncbi:TetR/AcrR family transcriptional regulator [Actinomycetospora termitidis]|uniref:TetR/AcrR family transcriptional regulator n=1 Tax=Actinomycetospora termitidis TaxID=3053470 RepID=A0ABT7M4T2_9PSEU|nr:TetR/AcrR family transcriptional regulator [Actinomycetospora sp. Odt1-22]MDL5155234.1 TetR/AcrR family transcriptional regulator [Actinomycetospora sp. Odt1-22]
MELTAGTAPTRRRDQILVEAARLFARHGFHGTSIDGIGAAAGVSGPAIYRHFPSKEGLLAEMLVGISEYLLDGARTIVAAHPDPGGRLTALVDFQVEFALTRPELITVQDRDLASLPDDSRRRVRALQRAYVEIWEDAIIRTGPPRDADQVRTAAHAAFGLINSTPRSAAHTSPEVAGAVLASMALAAVGA